SPASSVLMAGNCVAFIVSGSFGRSRSRHGASPGAAFAPGCPPGLSRSHPLVALRRRRRLCETRSVSLDRLRTALAVAGHSQAVLSHPETLASIGCFETPFEDWPVSNPFVALPALLCLGPADAVLVVADFNANDVCASDIRTVAYRSYDYRRPPDPAGE